MNFDRDKWTLENWKFRCEKVEYELDQIHSKLNEELAENRRLKLLLTGVMDKNCALRITLSPAVFDQTNFDAVQVLQRNHAKATAHEIEQMLGGPLRRLQEAVMHIHYLENHATTHGVKFQPWAVTERDKELYY